jgi:NADPH:quinone reductase-like Zn-dependent oxidoreductase
VVEDTAVSRPGPSEVIVQVSAAGINRGDIAAVAGAFKSKTPCTPGRDFAGVIVEGADTGLEVWGSGESMGINRDGAHAEFVTVPRDWLVPKPGRLSMAQAAGSGVPFIVAYEALVRVGQLRKDEILLITGADGAVGRAASQIAHRRGAKVIGVQKSSDSAGADFTIAIHSEVLDFVGLVPGTSAMLEAVKTLTHGAGVDIVLDAVGGDLFEAALTTLRPGGRQIAIASPEKRRVEFDLTDFYHNARVLYGLDSSGFTGQRSAVVLSELGAEFESGALKALPVDEVPLDGAVAAYETVQRGTAKREVLILK